jgi:hypothetical protein
MYRNKRWLSFNKDQFWNNNQRNKIKRIQVVTARKIEERAKMLKCMEYIALELWILFVIFSIASISTRFSKKIYFLS